VDVQVALVDGSYDEEASSDMAFKVAASMAMRSALREAGPVILEPVMDLEVVVPEQFTGDVISDLGARHAQIEGMTLRAGGYRAVRATVPLVEMFGYATDLRSLTQGRGTFTMEFDHYAPVSDQVMERLTGGWRH
jgi:elongation factor G